jgi:hydrogenase nickel incorporation protein HypB
VRNAADEMDLGALDVLVIENVGNLVCPANFDLGEAMKVVVLSTTEGDDKPLKYPAMFRNASVLVVNKIDLLPFVPCDIEALKRNARQINPDLLIFETSCTSRAGIAAWGDWLCQQAAAVHA